MFFIQLLFGRTHIFSPVEQCADDTIFGRYGMVAIPLQILVGVSCLPVYSGQQTSISLWDDKSVQEGHSTICSGVFSNKLYALIYGIDMCEELFLMG